MEKPVYVLASVLLLAALSGACSASADAPVQLGPDDNGSTVILPVGDSFNITLEGNLTTGYSWEADPAPDPSILEPVGEPAYQSESKALGAGGEFTFTYRQPVKEKPACAWFTTGLSNRTSLRWRNTSDHSSNPIIPDQPFPPNPGRLPAGQGHFNSGEKDPLFSQ
jgi:predicted secreted protein